MSLDHHIVTPFTAMLIENAEKDEIMLADQPKDPRKGCCPGQCLTLPILVSLMLCENSLWSELGTQGRCWQRFDLCNLQSCCCPQLLFPLTPPQNRLSRCECQPSILNKPKFMDCLRSCCLMNWMAERQDELLSPVSIMAERALIQRNMITDIKCLHFFETFILMGHPRAWRKSPAFSQAPQTQDPSQKSFYHMLNF